MDGDYPPIVVLSACSSAAAPDGTETARIASVSGNGTPLDAPANITFDNTDKSLLVTNHASIIPNPAHFAVLKVFAGDTADPLVKPILP